MTTSSSKPRPISFGDRTITLQYEYGTYKVPIHRKVKVLKNGKKEIAQLVTREDRTYTRAILREGDRFLGSGSAARFIKDPISPKIGRIQALKKALIAARFDRAQRKAFFDTIYKRKRTPVPPSAAPASAKPPRRQSAKASASLVIDVPFKVVTKERNPGVVNKLISLVKRQPILLPPSSLVAGGSDSIH